MHDAVASISELPQKISLVTQLCVLNLLPTDFCAHFAYVSGESADIRERRSVPPGQPSTKVRRTSHPEILQMFIADAASQSWAAGLHE